MLKMCEHIQVEATVVVKHLKVTVELSCSVVWDVVATEAEAFAETDVGKAFEKLVAEGVKDESSWSDRERWITDKRWSSSLTGN